MSFSEMNNLMNSACRTNQNSSLMQEALYKFGSEVNFKSKEEQEKYGMFVECYDTVHEKEMTPEMIALKEAFNTSFVEQKENTMTK